jgi:hypothetical protein
MPAKQYFDSGAVALHSVSLPSALSDFMQFRAARDSSLSLSAENTIGVRKHDPGANNSLLCNS